MDPNPHLIHQQAPTGAIVLTDDAAVFRMPALSQTLLPSQVMDTTPMSSTQLHRSRPARRRKLSRELD